MPPASIVATILAIVARCGITSPSSSFRIVRLWTRARWASESELHSSIARAPRSWTGVMVIGVHPFRNNNLPSPSRACSAPKASTRSPFNCQIKPPARPSPGTSNKSPASNPMPPHTLQKRRETAPRHQLPVPMPLPARREAAGTEGEPMRRIAWGNAISRQRGPLFDCDGVDSLAIEYRRGRATARQFGHYVCVDRSDCWRPLRDCSTRPTNFQPAIWRRRNS
jgi:hypothetical protein